MLVGEIVAPHGIKGEVRVGLTTDFPERFMQLDSIYVRPKRGPGALRAVASCRLRLDKRQVLMQFAGIDDRDAALELTGATLWVTEEQLVPLEPGTYYEFQILGLMARTTEGEELGPVTEIIHTGANDVYVTQRCLIPALNSVIAGVDLEAGLLLVNPVPGLLQ